MSIFRTFDRVFSWDREFFKDFDEMFKEIDEMKPGEAKNYKMSYHYETGMEAPEVKIEGDVDDQTIERFIKNAQKNTHFKELKEPKIQLLGEGKKESKKDKDSDEPKIEKIEE